ncbi:hypothetical protein Trydic_g13087 [Trypoxylus dichotomus]
MGKNWNKFALLTWKNWILQIRSPITTATEILLPVVFSVLLVLMRGLVKPETNADKFFEPFNVETFPLQSQFVKIAYSPCNQALQGIMINVAEKSNLSVECYKDSEELEIKLWNNMNETLAAVVFSDALLTQNDLDPNLTVTIRFPSELRNSTSPMLEAWNTHLTFPQFQLSGPREPEENEGASPNYFNEGFLTLQYYVSTEIIKYYANENFIELPQVLMQRFPYPSWLNDPLQTALESLISLLFMIAFSSVCINTVKVITLEKEKQLKEAMKIMGLTNWLHWTAWFLKTFVLILFTIILIVILLKVPWYPDSDVSVFTLTDPFLLFFFLVCFACATITLCFAISVFFSKANTATTVGGLIWFLSYAVYMVVQNQYDTLSLAEKILICLASNSAMAYGFQLLLMWEGTGRGLGWSNMFNSVSPDDSFTLGHVIIMLLLDAVIYMLIALYVEAVFPGDYGVPLPWYYPFTRSYWLGNKIHAETTKLDSLESDIYEKEPSNLKIGIQINRLKKVFPGEKVAVNDLSFNMFEGQVMVLLGHNGAGKTTTMSMLTGMMTPTSGTATVNGYDITKDMPRIRESLGLCPQHNILFDDLTVAEHLYFYNKLKGLNKKEIETETNTYIELLNLVSKRNAKSKTLSGGMKRKLNVAIALCGKSKICLLDEPTAGMDPAARRALWDVIIKQKQNRTILLSTHFMDEADLLGDRIAIMSGGELQCCGSSFFLKKKYGAGYHLIIDKSKDCDVKRVTELLRKHIPHITIETNVGSELSYILTENQATIFEPMFHELEANSKRLAVNSFGISLTTMEEVFMKVGTDHSQRESDITNLQMPIKNAHDMNSSNFSIMDDQILTGFSLWKNQFLAMLFKKICATYRNWQLLLIQNLIAVALIVLALAIANLTSVGSDLPSLKVSLDKFDNSTTAATSHNSSDLYFNEFLKILKNENRHSLNWNEENMTENMIREAINNLPRVRMSYVIGASFHENSIVAWFNNEPYHSAPISLQYAMNTILQQRTDANHRIEFINHPLPFSSDSQLSQISMGQGFQVAFNLAFCMCFVTPFYVLFHVKERVSKSKHLQFVSGAKITTFWLAAATWDFITFQLTTICLIIAIVCFQRDGFSTATEMGRLYVVLLMFILAVLPVTYLSSFLFDVPSSGYSRLNLFNILLGPAIFMVVTILSMEGLNLKTVSDALHYIFSIVPHYSVAYAFNTLSTKYDTIFICNEISSYNLSACLLNKACCDINENYFNLDDGIGLSLIYMGFVAVLASCILLSIEYRMFDKIIYAFINNKNKNSIERNFDCDDSDVLDEERKIKNGEIRPDEYDIILKDLTKRYSNYLAVNHLCVGIKAYECFGLLGVNGAGKTTTFKMMTGDVMMSNGDVWIRNLSLRTHTTEVYKHIGYCPQFDALLDELTARDTLFMYCLLRGIPYQDCSYNIAQLAHDFDFSNHLNKQVKQLSGGNKRKLSSAIALIGDPPVVFLDEPTAGMDPATKRNLWNTLCKIRDNGKCLVLTSHSMEECEALCTRLAIMVNGEFKCLGSTQHLKNKFSEGYMLVVKIRKIDSNENPDINATQALEQYIRNNFPSAVLREEHQELLTYFIPDMSLTWSKMFGIMERGKSQIENLEDYTLGQSNLEQVFLLFTKQQRII